MTGRWLGVLVTAAVLAACTGEGRGGPGPAPPSSRGPTRASPSPTVLPRLVLTADLSQRPRRWHRLTAIPFGPGRADLGMLPAGPHEPGPVVPISFAVAGDGSLWILDEVKHRLAHYTAAGAFLGAVGGIPFDRFHPRPRDLAMDGALPVVLEDGIEHQGIVAVPSEGGGFAPTTLHTATAAVHVSNLIQIPDTTRSSGPVVGQVEGRPFAPGNRIVHGPQGVADLGIPGRGLVRFLTGLPLGDGNHLGLRFDGPAELEVSLSDTETSSVLPIRLRLEAGGHPVRAFASGEFQTAVEHGVACVVQIAPSDPATARRYGGGRWFLELSDDGSPMMWERIPKPSFDDSSVVRPLAVGPGGSVYLMEIDRGGVAIARRITRKR